MKPLISTGKVVQAGNVVVLEEKHPRIRNNRDGTVIKLVGISAGKESEWRVKKVAQSKS